MVSASSLAQKLSGYETSPIRKASEVLPPALIQGEHFKVQDQVGWKEGLHLFKVEAGAKIGTKIFAPSIVPDELKIITDVSKTAYHKEWREIIEENHKALAAMKVAPELKAGFLDNPNINLTLQTLMIELLEAMSGVENRHIVIQQASLLQTDAEAVFFAESLMMAHWFHSTQVPGARMLGGTLIPVILTTDGRVIAFSASDFEYWTKLTAPIAAGFNRQYRRFHGGCKMKVDGLNVRYTTTNRSWVLSILVSANPGLICPIPLIASAVIL